ncbi:hypothetical protein PIB30_079215, partial [Stylosanthes scabra]|nr:hypothetical protein [Stylosanthes scabra]
NSEPVSGAASDHHCAFAAPPLCIMVAASSIRSNTDNRLCVRVNHIHTQEASLPPPSQPRSPLHRVSL